MQAPLPITARQRIRQQGTITREVETRHLGTPVLHDAENEKVHAAGAEDIKNPGYVTIKGGVTINMENYESLRIDVAISMPFEANPESREAMYQECSAFVEEKIAEQRNIAMGVTPEVEAAQTI